MSRFKFLSTTDEVGLARHVKDLRSELHSADPTTLALLTNTSYQENLPGEGAFQLVVWDQDVTVSYPEFIAKDSNSAAEMPIPIQALLAYYYYTADGTSLAGRWIAFSELPDGRFYSQAFQGYTGRQLVREFADDIATFTMAAETLPRAEWTDPGTQIGDRAFSFQALPCVPLLVVYWQGDEDFPSTYQILFDAAVVHYLPTDVCAILGSMLTRKLIAAKDSRKIQE